MKISKMTVAELLSYYEACNLVFEHYDSEAQANINEHRDVYYASKAKRDEMFEKSRKIFNEIEKRLEEV